MKKVGLISLGCDKNRVDTEIMLSSLFRAGFEICGDAGLCDVIVINTCAFIQSARQEAIDNILEMAEYKKHNCRCLVVAGCLTQKYLSELQADLKEVDIWLTSDSIHNLASILHNFFSLQKAQQKNENATNMQDNTYADSSINDCESIESVQLASQDDAKKSFRERYLTTLKHYAFLRIAEGCDNHCTFCTIPSIKGRYRSVPLDVLMQEAEDLASKGVEELILIAQDTGNYGADLADGTNLAVLLNKLSTIDGIRMLRIMYCYPERITDELISTIANNNKVLKYIDIPFQHADDAILKLMNRRSKSVEIKNLIHKLRSSIPDISIRSTFIVGFPGETEQHFQTLLEFLETERLDNAGFFAYSLEYDTPAAKLKGRVLKKEKLRRLALAGELQRKIIIEKNSKLIGSTVKAIYEGFDYDRKCFCGRTLANAPDVDCKIFFSGQAENVDTINEIRVLEVDEYDLIGELVYRNP